MTISNISRRRFLQRAGTLTAQTGLVGAGLTLLNTPTYADGCGISDWGGLPDPVDGWDCETQPQYNILEIHCQARASLWETFWLPGNGAAPNYSDFDMGLPDSAPLGPGGLTNALDLSNISWNGRPADFPCEAPDIPVSSTDAALFAAQSGGGNIYWGAPARPIFQRSDIFDRTRMVTQYHELSPHEAARPFCLTGLRLGNPRLAGTGAAIQRRARSVDPSEILPVSYIMHRSGSVSANYAAATGSHPGSSKPIVIQLSTNDNFHDSLSRDGITPESDAVLNALRHEYRDRMRFQGFGDPVRSTGFDSYWNAAELLNDAPALQDLFAGGLLEIQNNVVTCPDISGSFEPTAPAMRTMLEAAASLIETGPAKYVCCIDTGIGGTYDTHGSASVNHLSHVSTNFYNVMHHLAEVIHDPVNNPGGTLNLDNTMVVITTEFGRTPWINAADGRDHWPWGYLTTLIGGPITSAGGPSIQGAIDTATGETDAAHRYSPADIRGALLLAAGVDPFAPDNFRFSDFSDTLQLGVALEQDLRVRMKQWILGV